MNTKTDTFTENVQTLFERLEKRLATGIPIYLQSTTARQTAIMARQRRVPATLNNH